MQMIHLIHLITYRIYRSFTAARIGLCGVLLFTGCQEPGVTKSANVNETNGDVTALIGFIIILVIVCLDVIYPRRNKDQYP